MIALPLSYLRGGISGSPPGVPSYTTVPQPGLTPGQAAQQSVPTAAPSQPSSSGSVPDAVIARLMRGEPSEQDKWAALTKAGFAMMASQNPTALGGIGEGALVGISAYDAAKKQAMQDQVLAAGMAQKAEQIGVDKDRVKILRDTYDETVRRNKNLEKMGAKEHRGKMENARTTLDIARETLDQKAEQFNREQIDGKEFMASKTKYYDAVADFYGGAKGNTATDLRKAMLKIYEMADKHATKMSDPYAMRGPPKKDKDGKPIPFNSTEEYQKAYDQKVQELMAASGLAPQQNRSPGFPGAAPGQNPAIPPSGPSKPAPPGFGTVTMSPQAGSPQVGPRQMVPQPPAAPQQGGPLPLNPAFGRGGPPLMPR